MFLYLFSSKCEDLKNINKNTVQLYHLGISQFTIKFITKKNILKVMTFL